MLQGQPAAGVPAVPANRLPGDAPPVGGQPASVQPASAGHRWLFIVETSSPMRRRQTATLKAVDELLGSQMRGQLRTGDSLALWTFNETLSPARLPVQKWSVTNHMAIVGRVHAFLQARTYEKTPSLSDAVPAILRLVESSDVLTVLLISSGETKLQGTPFDDKINRVFDTWRDTQRRANTPFLTVLRSRKGQLTDCAATPAQWEAELPPLPALELDLVREPKTPPAPQPPPEVVPPLILIGKKLRQEEASTSPAPATVPEAKPAVAAAALPPLDAPRNAETSNVLPKAGQPATTSVAPDGQGHPAEPIPRETVASPLSPGPLASPSLPALGATGGVSDAREHTNRESSPRLIGVGGPELANPGGFSRRQGFGLAGLLFAAGGLGLFFWLRRPAAPTRSLITQSLERAVGPKPAGKKERKPDRQKIDDV